MNSQERFIEYEFEVSEITRLESLVSVLPEAGFEGFEECERVLKAYIPEMLCKQNLIQDILDDNGLGDLHYKCSVIEPRNWNEEWEKGFAPMLIAGRVFVRAPFHTTQPAEYELVIEPKMSFGTGHHATTSMMIQFMLELDFRGKEVLDFGCGTGILAILAEKQGASVVLAIDNDDWSITNCGENLTKNSCSRIKVIKADHLTTEFGHFEMMLANINRKVIMAELGGWKKCLSENGLLLVSGILESDVNEIINEALRSGFLLTAEKHESGWASLLFKSN